MSKPNIGVRVLQNDQRFDEKQVVIFKREAPDEVAQLAMNFLERWGLVACVLEGEDSAGRQKMRLPTSEEVTARAFDIAERAFAEARARGHMLDLPDMNELNADVDAAGAA